MRFAHGSRSGFAFATIGGSGDYPPTSAATPAAHIWSPRKRKALASPIPSGGAFSFKCLEDHFALAAGKGVEKAFCLAR
jgi:hypothetical protein